jgi:hypothetical protein
MQLTVPAPDPLRLLTSARRYPRVKHWQLMTPHTVPSHPARSSGWNIFAALPARLPSRFSGSCS